MRRLILLALILLVALFANAQTATKPQVQVVPAKQTPPIPARPCLMPTVHLATALMPRDKDLPLQR
jgi:hypothetical protein